MINDDLYDLGIAFATILGVFALSLVGTEDWLSAIVIGLSMLLVLFKDHILHRRLNSTRH